MLPWMLLLKYSQGEQTDTYVLWEWKAAAWMRGCPQCLLTPALNKTQYLFVIWMHQLLSGEESIYIHCWTLWCTKFYNGHSENDLDAS